MPRRGRSSQVTTHRLVLACALVAMWLLAAHPAAATTVGGGPALVPRHTELRSIVPASGATLSSPPTAIEMTFNENISPVFAQVSLTRDGTVVPTPTPKVTAAVLTVALDPGLPAGSYRVGYRVVSADGHPISGESTFAVAGTGATTPSTPTLGSPQPPTTASPTAAASATSQPAPAAAGTTANPGSTSRSPGLVVAIGLILVAIAMLIWELRRRRRDASGL